MAVLELCSGTVALTISRLIGVTICKPVLLESYGLLRAHLRYHKNEQAGTASMDAVC
jgi:hypothetical protein